MTAPIVPAATVPVVDAGGVMRPHFSAFLDGIATVRSADSVGDTFVIDRIPSGRSLIKVNFDLVPASDNVSLYLFARTGTGDDATAYSWAWPYNNAAATAAADANTGDTKVIVAAAVQADANTGGVHGELTISNIQSTRYKRVGGWCAHFDGSRERFTGVAGRIDTELAITGLRLAFSSGAIASGWARVDAP